MNAHIHNAGDTPRPFFIFTLYTDGAAFAVPVPVPDGDGQFGTPSQGFVACVMADLAARLVQQTSITEADRADAAVWIASADRDRA